METKTLLRITNLSKAFAGVQALDGVSFDLRAGEVHALMGENGAGKSTLMKALAGIHQPDAGEIWLDGHAVQITSPRHAQDLGIGIVHQELHLMNHLNAAQNIYIGREPRRCAGLLLDERALEDQTAQLFKRLNMRLDPRTPVGQLTVAGQQLVEIAKALSMRSKLLILDEPTAALNPEEVEDLFRIVRQLRDEGVAIVYISHKMDELRRIANRLTVMRDGRTIATRPVADISMDEIIAMMVGRAVDTSARPNLPAVQGEALLSVKNLQRGKAVRDVSFEARRGEILGFAGLMGAGRTEVARAVFGADKLDAGEIRVSGKVRSIRSPRDAVRAGIGYLSEDRKQFGLATGMDVESNMVMAALPRFLRAGTFMNRVAMRSVADALIKRLAIRTPSATQLVRLLSGGNQQKVVIAKWLLRDCDILFFDEPTRGIDVGAKAEIHKLIDALAAQGKAIVVISSELPEILRLSHRVMVMCEGRVTGELDAREATQETIMQLATRCARRSTSGSSDEITTMALPSAASAFSSL